MGRLLNLALSADAGCGMNHPLGATDASEKRAELSRLVEIVAKHHGFSPADTAEALEVAHRDIDGWLIAFRLLAAEIPATEPDRDDRITCRQCAELSSSGRCGAAKDGRMTDALRDYSPVQDVLRRCEFFRAVETRH